MAFQPTTYNSPSPDNLWGGTQITTVTPDPMPVRMDAVNKVYLRGTVLGLVTMGPGDAPEDPLVPLPPEDYILVPVDKAATDGSEKVYAILADSIDVETDDYVTAPVYLTGEFNELALIFLSGDDPADHRLSARDRGIFFKINVPAN